VTKQRVQTGFNSNFFQAGTNILNIEGWKGLYRGGKSQLMRELPFNAVQFVIFNQLKTFKLISNESKQTLLFSSFVYRTATRHGVDILESNDIIL